MPGSKWKVVRIGTYNSVFFNNNADKSFPSLEYKGGVILKVPKRDMSSPKRQMRIAKQLYPDMPTALYKSEQDSEFPKVEVKEKKQSRLFTTGLIMPHFQFSSQAQDDEEVAKEILNIYRRERRILLDGCNHGNFRRATATGPLKAVSYDTAKLVDSPISEQLFPSAHHVLQDFEDYWDSMQDTRALTIKMIKILLWLEENIPLSSIKNLYLDYDFLMTFVIDNLEEEVISEITVHALYILHELDPSFSIDHYWDRLWNDTTLCERLIKQAAEDSFSAVSCLELLDPSKMSLLKKVAEDDKAKYIHAMNKLIHIISEHDLAAIEPRSILNFHAQLTKNKDVLTEFKDVIDIIKRINAELLITSNLEKLLDDDSARKSLIDHYEKRVLSVRICRQILEGKPISSESTWQPLAKGAYNFVYFKKDTGQGEFKGPAVLKIKIDDYELSDPVRAVRLSREINPTLPVKLVDKFHDDSFPHVEYSCEDGEKQSYAQGWLMPYLPHVAGDSDDMAISKEILDIYRKHGRIIVDGCGKENFRKADKKGPVVCVDYDWAVRRGSIVSMSNSKNIHSLHKRFDTYWKSYEYTKPNSVRIIRSLVWLEYNLRPGIIPREYLEHDFLLLFSGEPKLKINMHQLHAAYALYKINPYLVAHSTIVKLGSQELRERLLKSTRTGAFSDVDCLKLLYPECKIFEALDEKSTQSMIKLIYLLGRYLTGLDVLKEIDTNALLHFNKLYKGSNQLFKNFEAAYSILDTIHRDFNHIVNCQKLLLNYNVIEQIIKLKQANALLIRNCLVILVPSVEKHLYYCTSNHKDPMLVQNAVLWLSKNFVELDISKLSSETLYKFSEEFSKNENIAADLDRALDIIRVLNPKLLTTVSQEKLLMKHDVCQRIIQANQDNNLSVISCGAILKSSPLSKPSVMEEDGDAIKLKM